MQTGRERTVTRSFRIKESAFTALQEEADKRNVSVNTLLNLILMSFSEYDRFLEEFNMVKLSRQTFRRILQASTAEAVKEAGRRSGETLPKSFILAKSGRVSREALIDYLRLMSRYANLFEFNVSRNSEEIKVTLVHDLGAKGSEFFGEYAKGALQEVGVNETVEFDEDSVTLTIVPKAKEFQSRE